MRYFLVFEFGNQFFESVVLDDGALKDYEIKAGELGEDVDTLIYEDLTGESNFPCQAIEIKNENLAELKELIKKMESEKPKAI